MEGYTYSTFPESGESSPQCRETDTETAISWDETPQPTAAARVKIMCSYNGRIQPRPHDNQLSYFGGETKILAVDRSIRFPAIIAKLSSLYGASSPDEICFKYQLPGEDLDALISVTNDEDLDHMMIEYDRLHSSGGKPAARLRLFLFATNSSGGKKADRMWFDVDRNPLKPPPPAAAAAALVPDFLSGINVENNVGADSLVGDAVLVRSDGAKEETRINAGEIQEIQQLAYHGEFYTEKTPAAAIVATSMPATTQIPAGYWADQRGIAGGRFASVTGGEQPVYLIPASHSLYPANTGQGYYTAAPPAFSRVLTDVYRDVPAMYAVAAPQGMEGSAANSPAAGYAAASQVGYDSMGRAVFYPYQAVSNVALNAEQKMNKNSQIS